MIGALRRFWTERSGRERQLLAVMLALAAILLLVFAIVRPIAAARKAAHERLDRATLDAGQIGALSDNLRRARKEVPPPLTGALVLAVSQSANAAGFTLAGLDPQGTDRVGFTMASAKSAALFAWLRVLAAQGVVVERMTLRTNSDATVAVDATLRARPS